MDLPDLVHTVGRRLLHEPLLHFAVLGAAIFVGHHLIVAPAPDPAEIVVTAERVTSLAAQFSGMHGGRPPREDELRAAIDTYVRDEMLYREGLALGLDRDDPVVRNRVRQKASILSDDALAAEPTETELEAFLKAHQSEFDIPARVSFEQVYFDPTKHPADLKRVVAAARAALVAGTRADALTDPTLLPSTVNEVLPSDVDAVFGDSFGKQLAELESGTWEGPLLSTFGVHLVRITWRGEGTPATLANARDVIAREWSREHALKVRAQFYRTLAKRYSVRIEPYAGTVRTAAN